MKKKLIFDQEVYTFQIDFAQHVSNIVYIQWMEIGRLKLLQHIGMPIHKLAERGITPILIHTDINYKRALYIDDIVKIETWVSKLRNASAVMSFNFYNSKNELAAFGTQTGLFINIETKKPVRIGAEEQEAFKKILFED